MRRTIKKWLQRLHTPLVIIIVTCAILSTLFRALTPWVNHYKTTLEQKITQRMGQPVTIQSMATTWYWFIPVLKLNEVQLTQPQQHLNIKTLLVGINLWRSLIHWRVEPGLLYIDDAHLTLRELKTGWQLEGLHQASSAPVAMDLQAYRPVFEWLTQQSRIIVKDISADLYFKNHTVIPLRHVQLRVKQAYGHLRLSGEAVIARQQPTTLRVLGELSLGRADLAQSTGRLYVAANHLQPQAWMPFVPQSAYQIQAGSGAVELWIDIAKQQINQVQARVAFQNLLFQTAHLKQPVTSLTANTAWKRQNNDWILRADKVRLCTPGQCWPENKFSIAYQQELQTYRLFIQTLLLKPLFSLQFDWPKSLEHLRRMHVNGELHNVQWGMTPQGLDYFLTQFSNLGWTGQAPQRPSVRHLSGVLYWQPKEGRLELDSHNTTLTLPQSPPVVFTQLNGAIDWKELSHGLRLTLERLVVTHPLLTLSAKGVLDEPTSERGYLRLKADFSAHDATHWLPYVPGRFLKPKLEHWLKHDIKRIASASGQISIDGLLCDFPFDTPSDAPQKGQFTIHSFLQGVDLWFHEDWPLTTDIDAHLQVNGRHLDADVLHANLHGVPVDKLRLRVDDLGLDKEVLWAHGQMNAPFKNMLQYIQDSPLKSRLAKLSRLDISEPLNLDLQLEVPLYPGNDDVLVKGDMTFDDHQLVLKDVLNHLIFQQTQGRIAFTEKGIQPSHLTAVLMNEPVNVVVQAMEKPLPGTEIQVSGDFGVEALKQLLGFDAMDFIQGRAHIETVAQLTNAADQPDLVHVNSDLQGVAVRLPKPLKKNMQSKAPLAVDIALYPQKMNIVGHYIPGLKTNLWLNTSTPHQPLVFERGIVGFGPVDMKTLPDKGLSVVGRFAQFDVQPWQDWAEKRLSNQKQVSWSMLHSVDVTCDDLLLWHQHYQAIGLHVKPLPQQKWSIHFKQPRTQAQLLYDSVAYTIKGHFDHLWVDPDFFAARQSNVTSLHLKPEQIPALDIAIDDFQWGKMQLGSAALKTSSHPQTLRVDQANIKSPVYELNMTGTWRQKGTQDSTHLEAALNVTDLSKSLERWNITPAVGAKKGDIQLKGNWPGPLYHFVLGSFTGESSIIFKNGRISHFDRETEEKLGLGKLLSILSLQTIPRRLTLDFSDLAQGGYSFDIFKGTFTLKNGVMRTNDSYIDGPVAYASMRGDLDLKKQWYDLDLRVSPHITASLPVVVTIAGGPVAGPIAGIATWVAMKIINQGVEKISSYSYKITGPWLEPVVQQVSIDKKAAAQ